MRKLVTYKFESSSRSSLHWIIIYILYNAMWWRWWWWDVRYVCFLLSSCEDVSTDCEDCHAGVPTCLVSTLIMMVGNRHWWWWWWWRRFWSPSLPSSSLKVSFCIIHELANLDLWLRRLHWRKSTFSCRWSHWYIWGICFPISFKNKYQRVKDVIYIPFTK